MKKAKAISRAFGVTLALVLLPYSAQAGAGAGLQRAGNAPDFVVGSAMSVGAMSLRDANVIWPGDDPDAVWSTSGENLQIGALSMMSLSETGLTLAPVGSSGDVRWGLFNRGAWEASDAATEIPEPAPLAILGIAILALGFYRRYRNA